MKKPNKEDVKSILLIWVLLMIIMGLALIVKWW